MPSVNPTILRWARETAGLSLEEAARKLGINAAGGFSADRRLLRLEQGEEQPTRANLSKMASAYRRPLLTFYMAAPPAAEERVEDFRTLPDRREDSEALVQALVRDVRARQALVHDILEDEESPPLGFVGSRRTADGVLKVADAITKDLQFSTDAYRATANADQAFAYLRERAETAGVFVLLIGDLGSHHTELDAEAFRGFALSDKIAPFVVVNDRDAHTAWSFTLLHELAHIWLGMTGVSGGHDAGGVERFCNEVAGQVLLPTSDLQAIAGAAIEAGADVIEVIGAEAARRRVSRTLVAFRLYQAGAITEDLWEDLRATFRAAWIEGRRQRKAERKGQTGGPDFYVVRRQRLGRALIELVERAVRDGALSPTKAGRVLGVRPRNVEPLLNGRAA